MKALFKNLIMLAALFSLACTGEGKMTNPYPEATLHHHGHELLTTWGEALLRCQISDSDPGLDGGLLCPACGRIHGRSTDAVLPLMYMADNGGGGRYLEAAKRLMRWGRNVKRHDGAWLNDVNVSDWDGTTVFAAIALYEALHHHSHLLDDSTRRAWVSDLSSAGEFIYRNDFIYSRRRIGWRNMNVNYSASATYALFALGEMFGRDHYVAKARELAGDMNAFFTVNDGFLYGEGQDMNKTPKGCLPVDLLYNVEESLPNMAYYAQMAGDTVLMANVERSMRTHLEFMLPDGGWDDSWGTRSFKWCYWGGRTSDGFMGGYYLLGERNPQFDEAIRRNIALLAGATHQGLLYGGMHYRENGYRPCVHHTFGHAKALASMLNQPEREAVWTKLPREQQSGVKHFRDINTWLVSSGGLRATLTDYDSQYKVKGTHPMGAALAMVWHEKTGPLFAASMNKYSMIEAPNMQSDLQREKMCATPRVEMVRDGVMYSNLDALRCKVDYTQQGDRHIFSTVMPLVDLNQNPPSSGAVVVETEYVFSPNTITVTVRSDMKTEGLRVVLPLIASREDKIETFANKTLKVERNGAEIFIATDGEIELLPSNDGRIMAMTPGMSFIPVSVPLRAKEVKVELTVN